MLIDPRFSPQVLPARSSPVVDPRFSAQVPCTVQPAMFVKKSAMSLTSSLFLVEEPAAEAEQFSDRASRYGDEAEVSDLESTGRD